jgi:hypothetical protein
VSSISLGDSSGKTKRVREADRSENIIIMVLDVFQKIMRLLLQWENGAKGTLSSVGASLYSSSLLPTTRQTIFTGQINISPYPNVQENE